MIYIISLLEDPKLTVPSLSFVGDTKNTVKQIATILNRAINAPQDIDTQLTTTYPRTTFPS